MNESRFDLLTSIISIVAGSLVAYFTCNALIPPIESVSFETIESATSPSVADPNLEIFNPDAINPTVEVFIGSDGDYRINYIEEYDDLLNTEEGSIDEFDELLDGEE